MKKFKWMILYYLIKRIASNWFYGENIALQQKVKWQNLTSTLAKSPFYSSFKNHEDFPIIDKHIFMSHFDEINTCGITKKNALDVAIKAEQSRDFSPMIHNITVGLSTGTSGNRGIFLASDKDRAQWVASIINHVIPFPTKKTNVAFFLRSNSNLYTATSSNLLSFHYFDIMNDIASYAKKLQNTYPDIIVAQPSVLSILAQLQLDKMIQLKPTKIISVAEVLTPEDRNFIMQAFDQMIHQVYQCTEGLLASTCEYGTLHFHERDIIIEKKMLDEHRFHPIITDLHRSAQPVIRYELNDIIVEKHSCQCGSPCMAIEYIEGRSDDVFYFKNNNQSIVAIFPDFIRKAVVLSHENIMDYYVNQNSDSSIMLYVEPPQFFEIVSKNLKDLFDHYNLSPISMDQQLDKPWIKGNKKIRIKNSYGKSN